MHQAYFSGRTHAIDNLTERSLENNYIDLIFIKNTM